MPKAWAEVSAMPLWPSDPALLARSTDLEWKAWCLSKPGVCKHYHRAGFGALEERNHRTRNRAPVLLCPAEGVLLLQLVCVHPEAVASVSVANTQGQAGRGLEWVY